MKLYARTLEEVKVIPAGVPYRETVEKFTKYRLKVVQDNEDVRGPLFSPHDYAAPPPRPPR